MKQHIQIVHEPTALYRMAAGVYVASTKKAVAGNGRFTVVLSGGSTPKALYSLLGNDVELRSHVPWQQTYFFFGDERKVGPSGADSNYRMAHEAMLSEVPVSSSHLFRMKGELRDADKAAAEYEQGALRILRSCTRPAPSIRPGDAWHGTGWPHCLVISRYDCACRANSAGHRELGAEAEDRITMTAPVLNNAAAVMFMVHGQEKARALKAVLEGPYVPQKLPARLIHPHKGSLLWLVDEAAAALLDRRFIPTVA